MPCQKATSVMINRGAAGDFARDRMTGISAIIHAKLCYDVRPQELVACRNIPCFELVPADRIRDTGTSKASIDLNY